MKNVKIYCKGYCNSHTQEGGYSVVVKCNNVADRIDGKMISSSSNKCILQGLIIGVGHIKEACNVELVVSCLLGFQSYQKGKGINKSMIGELINLLDSKSCRYSISELESEGSMLNALIESFDIRNTISKVH